MVYFLYHFPPFVQSYNFFLSYILFSAFSLSCKKWDGGASLFIWSSETELKHETFGAKKYKNKLTFLHFYSHIFSWKGQKERRLPFCFSFLTDLTWHKTYILHTIHTCWWCFLFFMIWWCRVVRKKGTEDGIDDDDDYNYYTNIILCT